jgi:hypothetical protein
LEYNRYLKAFLTSIANYSTSVPRPSPAAIRPVSPQQAGGILCR